MIFLPALGPNAGPGPAGGRARQPRRAALYSLRPPSVRRIVQITSMIGRFAHDLGGSESGPGCVKTPTSNFRVEILSRLRWIGKELLCQSSPKEEKGENNSAHSLLARVFTQPRSFPEVTAQHHQVRFTPTTTRHRQRSRSRPKSADSVAKLPTCRVTNFP